MSILPPRRDGYYDECGNWKRTKFCFVDCGSRCTCRPPFDQYFRKPPAKREETVVEIEPGDSPANRALHDAGNCLFTCAICYAEAVAVIEHESLVNELPTQE